VTARRGKARVLQRTGSTPSRGGAQAPPAGVLHPHSVPILRDEHGALRDDERASRVLREAAASETSTDSRPSVRAS
jgi:hypothetical protein